VPVFNAHLVGHLGSEPHLVADRADVVRADRVDWPRRPADRADEMFAHTICSYY